MTQPTPISGRNCLHLSGLLEQTAAMVAKLGTEFDHYRCKLNELNSRYAVGRFHLAVLGQFKRGKSTLLNALNFLQKCDSAMFLISVDPPITELELEFLRQVREKVPRLFFVMNKFDYLDERELEQALSFYKHVLSEQAEWDGEIPVFCVSALKGLDARTDKDLQNRTSSGRNNLNHFGADQSPPPTKAHRFQ